MELVISQYKAVNITSAFGCELNRSMERLVVIDTQKFLLARVYRLFGLLVWSDGSCASIEDAEAALS